MPALRTDPPEGVELSGRYGGHEWKLTGHGRFEFPSKSEPGVTHITDIFEGHCTCWSFQLKRCSDGLCIHLRLVKNLLKKLKQQQP